MKWQRLVHSDSGHLRGLGVLHSDQNLKVTEQLHHEGRHVHVEGGGGLRVSRFRVTRHFGGIFFTSVFYEFSNAQRPKTADVLQKEVAPEDHTPWIYRSTVSRNKTRWDDQSSTATSDAVKHAGMNSAAQKVFQAATVEDDPRPLQQHELLQPPLSKSNGTMSKRTVFVGGPQNRTVVVIRMLHCMSTMIVALQPHSNDKTNETLMWPEPIHANIQHDDDQAKTESEFAASVLGGSNLVYTWTVEPDELSGYKFTRQQGTRMRQRTRLLQEEQERIRLQAIRTRYQGEINSVDVPLRLAIRKMTREVENVQVDSKLIDMKVARAILDDLRVPFETPGPVDDDVVVAAFRRLGEEKTRELESLRRRFDEVVKPLLQYNDRVRQTLDRLETVKMESVDRQEGDRVEAAGGVAIVTWQTASSSQP